MSVACRVCHKSSGDPIFSGPILGASVQYYECSACGYVQTEHPHWLDVAYASAINRCDTGILLRNQLNVGGVLATLTVLGKRTDRIVDYAGGYGILVRMLRDRGLDALWSDPYCQNLFAIGFEYQHEPASLVTAFEAFEHFIDPVQELEKLLTIAPNLLFSTEIIPSPTPSVGEWWYYGADHGQHIGFFRVRTLQYLAQRFGRHLTTDGKHYHLLTQSPLPSWSWQLARGIARAEPRLFTLGMKTRVGADFEKLSGFSFGKKV